MAKEAACLLTFRPQREELSAHAPDPSNGAAFVERAFGEGANSDA